MTTSTAATIAEFLRLRFERKQLVQAGIAKALGIGPTHMSLILRGLKPFPLKHLDEVARFFDLDAVDFILLAQSEVQRASRKGEGAEPEIRDAAHRIEMLKTESKLPRRKKKGGDE